MWLGIAFHSLLRKQYKPAQEGAALPSHTDIPLHPPHHYCICSYCLWYLAGANVNVALLH